MHQLKEADMMSAKLDLIMKKLEERDIEKKEVMHINDSCMTCEECEDIGHSRNNCPTIQKDVNYINNNNSYLIDIHNAANYYTQPADVKWIDYSLPDKKGDPGRPVISISIGCHVFLEAICDFGASVNIMPKVFMKKF
jgi:hypothetical protein